jgi:DNA-binding FadR family transcriptional regulator
MLGGEFEPGSRLPAERDLARQLGVSRPSVREALIALEVEGWVEVRTGSGVYVLDRARRTSSRSVPAAEWGPLELIRARRVIEGEIAAQAAQHAKRKHVAAMRAALASMNQDAARDVAPLDGDRAFHTAVASACDNVVLLETVQAFWDARHGPLFERLGDWFETVPSWRIAIADHDPEAARAAMQNHMDQSHARFSASWRSTRKNAA